MMAHISAKGLRLIQNWEGLRLDAYQDSGGIWTIGWGHTGPEVIPGLTITRGLADSLLRQDVERFEQAVENSLTHPASQGQFDALVSFAYNVGVSGFRDSRLLKKFNAEDIAGAALQFEEWIRDDKKVIQLGLVRRRAQEMLRFLREDLG